MRPVAASPTANRGRSDDPADGEREEGTPASAYMANTRPVGPARDPRVAGLSGRGHRRARVEDGAVSTMTIRVSRDGAAPGPSACATTRPATAGVAMVFPRAAAPAARGRAQWHLTRLSPASSGNAFRGRTVSPLRQGPAYSPGGPQPKTPAGRRHRPLRLHPRPAPPAGAGHDRAPLRPAPRPSPRLARALSDGGTGPLTGRSSCAPRGRPPPSRPAPAYSPTSP